MNKCIIFLRVSTQAQEFESQKQSLTQLRMTVADIVSKVDNKVYVYQIKTKKVSWKLVHIKKEADI